MVAATPGTEIEPPTDNAGCDILSFTFGMLAFMTVAIASQLSFAHCICTVIPICISS